MRTSASSNWTPASPNTSSSAAPSKTNATGGASRWRRAGRESRTASYNRGFHPPDSPHMRLSQFHLATVKEVPADAEIASHQLMIRAGMIRKLAAGLYTWSPLGLRVLRKVENVVREEMDRAGAVELLMPTIQPQELWEESGRWEKFGPQL